ncbi:hypothetical protein [Cucumibacter marinus]|uniref:hypothetical protein n=1 Tax=Cucumibacter marinus TaxID=1121252 RepID=UPI00041E2173|nr:hypothetical protein [Cucumibacter marinus]
MKHLLVALLVVGTFNPIVILAQDNADADAPAVELPAAGTGEQYTRFLSRIPNLPVLENGGEADLLVQYFANRKGEVAGLSYTAINAVDSASCDLFSRGAEVCWCAGDEPEPRGCAGDFGGGGGTGVTLQTVDLDVVVLPTLSPRGDMDFSLQVQRKITEDLKTIDVPGFSLSAEEQQQLLEQVE